MPDYSAAPAGLTLSEDCASRQGVALGYIGLFSDIASVTELNGTITAITLNANKSLYKVEAEYKSATAEAVRTADTGTYLAQVLNVRFTGNDAATTLNINRWAEQCRVVFIPVGVNGQAKVYGLEVVGSTLKISTEPGRLTRHLDSFGERGNDDARARNEFDFSAEHDYAPLNVDPSILDALVL